MVDAEQRHIPAVQNVSPRRRMYHGNPEVSVLDLMDVYLMVETSQRERCDAYSGHTSWRTMEDAAMEWLSTIINVTYSSGRCGKKREHKTAETIVGPGIRQW